MEIIKIFIGLILLGCLIYINIDKPKEENSVKETPNRYITIKVYGVTKENLGLEYTIFCELVKPIPNIELKLTHQFKNLLMVTSAKEIDKLNENFAIILKGDSIEFNHVICIPTIESKNKIERHLNLKNV
jgi:hypothetical protein